MKPTILVLVGYYLPGYKAGGVLRSIANTVEHLHDAFDFRIVTRDRDLGDAAPYSEIEPDRWSASGPAQVFHAGPSTFSGPGITRLVGETPHDLLYLNEFMEPWLSSVPLLARKFGRIPPRPTIMAPRGVFSAGALSIRAPKKRLYIMATRAVGVWRNLVWQASSSYEADDIRRVMGADARTIRIASDPPRPAQCTEAEVQERAPQAPLRVLFLSRIAPMKNLDFALDVLRQVRAPVQFSIYGPAEDRGYWDACQTRMSRLPSNVKATYEGSVAPDEVPAVLRAHDLFFLPSRGENFGHVIAEAISAGTPVLVSTQTPWRDLEAAGIGRDLPLSEPLAFAAYIEEVAAYPPEKYRSLRQSVMSYRSPDGLRAVEDHRTLFSEALGRAAAV